jgi:hypothetical protein
MLKLEKKNPNDKATSSGIENTNGYFNLQTAKIPDLPQIQPIQCTDG